MKRWKMPTVPEWVFATSSGQPPSPDTERSRFAQLRDAAGLPEHHTPHSLRHSYASLLLQNGESVMYVRAQMGHASIKMTVDLYGRWLEPEPIRGGVNYLDSFTRRF